MRTFFIIVCILLVYYPSHCLSGETAMHDAYFDLATGHKYLKNTNGTYLELSRKGRLLRADYPGTSPLLKRGKYIRKITENSYFVYEKKEDTGVVRRILPAAEKHPEGWFCRQLFEKVNKPKLDTGLGYTKGAGSIGLTTQ